MSNIGPSQRQLRVGEELRHALSQTLRRGHFHDEVLFNAAPNLSVTEVRISPDLKNATAYMMVLGGQGLDQIIPALNDAAGYFQREIAHQMKMRFTPKLRFVVDESFENAAKIESLLRSLPKASE